MGDDGACLKRPRPLQLIAKHPYGIIVYGKKNYLPQPGRLNRLERLHIRADIGGGLLSSRAISAPHCDDLQPRPGCERRQGGTDLPRAYDRN